MWSTRAHPQGPVLATGQLSKAAVEDNRGNSPTADVEKHVLRATHCSKCYRTER